MPESMAVAVDIGGTKVAAGLVDASGRLVHKSSVPTERGGAGALTDCVLALIEREIEGAAQEIVGVGVAVAAAVDPGTGDVLWAPNIPGWVDVPLGRLVGEATNLPVSVGFDGQFAALGEHWAGAGRGVRNMVLIVIGTGVGGGLILDGRLYHGSQNLAGAAGWLVVEPDHVTTEQSRSQGNLESIVSGPAIVRSAEQLLSLEGEHALDGPITTASVIQRALDGDVICQRVLQHAGNCLGRAVAGIVSLLNPDLVLLGGGLGSTGIFLDAGQGGSRFVRSAD
jgi:glucokinase